jgi:hypothetical protein
MPYALCPVVPHLSEKGYTSKLATHYCSIVSKTTGLRSKIFSSSGTINFQNTRGMSRISVIILDRKH